MTQPPSDSVLPLDPFHFALKRPLLVRTSDSILWRRCRRKWMFQSHSALYREPVDNQIAALWFGTGFHFAMEDYHGRNLFGHPFEAYRAYMRCFKKSQAPDNYAELTELAKGMFDYYVASWLPRHNEFQTYILDDVPQVEVEFRVPIPGLSEDEAIYGGTFDRIVTDPFGRLYVLDWKTAARIDVDKLETDPQVSAYLWAARQLYGPTVEGIVYVQFLKKLQEPPKRLNSGGFSVNRQVACTHSTYRAALVEEFGFVPQNYIEFLNYLAGQEGPDGDMFIKRNIVRRSDYQIFNEGPKIAMQTREMLNPLTELYPNPTNMCPSDCKFRTPCLAIDSEDDWEQILKLNYSQRMELHNWRQYVKWPEISQPEISQPEISQPEVTQAEEEKNGN